MFSLVKRWAPSKPDARDQELCQGVLEALEAAGEAAAGVGLCSIQGSWARHTAVMVPDEGELDRVFSVDELRKWWGSFSRKHVLLLNASAEVVYLARKRAASDRGSAAILLARVVLLEAKEGPLAPAANERLLELAGKMRS